MAELKWLKVCVELFDDTKMIFIENLPEGDTLLVIWLKLLVLAAKVNDYGLIYITREVPYTEDTLTNILCRPKNCVTLALQTFKKLGMIEIENNIISIMNWEKHQSVDKIDEIRKQNRSRQAIYRAKQKEITLLVTSRDATEETKTKTKTKTKNRKEEDINIYIQIFDHYNSKNIIIHKKPVFIAGLKKKHKDIINLHGKEAINQAIDNYATVFHGEEYFFNYRWGLLDFLARGITKFVNEARPLDNFLKQGYTKPPTPESVKNKYAGFEE